MSTAELVAVVAAAVAGIGITGLARRDANTVVLDAGVTLALCVATWNKPLLEQGPRCRAGQYSSK